MQIPKLRGQKFGTKISRLNGKKKTSETSFGKLRMHIRSNQCALPRTCVLDIWAPKNHFYGF